MEACEDMLFWCNAWLSYYICPINLQNFTQCYQWCIDDFPVEKTQKYGKNDYQETYHGANKLHFCLYVVLEMYVVKFLFAQ